MKLALRQVKHLRPAVDFHREQPISLAPDGLAQGRGRGVEQRGQIESLELASLMKQLPGREVAEDDLAGRVGEHRDQRGRLYDRIEQQLALIQVHALAAQQLADGVVRDHEFAEVIVGDMTDADAEVAVAHALDAVADGAENVGPGGGHPAGQIDRRQ